MKVNGIIAEYNPFHNGHKYHMEESRRSTGADYTIIAMSGNFMQRGAPALLDKYTRTKMALLGGADLVLEIPAFYACGSAEYFATGAAALLDKLGVVDYLCFGSEWGREDVLYRIARILSDEPEGYRLRLRTELRQGRSFPAARCNALMDYCPALGDSIMDVFSSPNNILGIEYLKALTARQSAIVPHTTKRIGSDYHDKRLGENQSSALAIRHAIFSRLDLDFLSDQMPGEALEIMKEALSLTMPIRPNDFSLPLHYKLLQETEEGYEKYMDVSPDLSDRILKSVYQFTGFSGFCDFLKTRNLTYTRISRCMTHILLNITKAELEAAKAIDHVPYARVLGFRRSASPLLSAIREHSSIPMVTRLSEARSLLSEPAWYMLRRDIAIANLYNSTAAQRPRTPAAHEPPAPRAMINEYSSQPVIV